ncbi:speckle-type POZ protein B-like [Belonocnema kinseyi]|uniref:speckle-type POZ protein B-like n=1 Tax=Belonocnema kinseyi TaxID=2817044 RepID=UPI00143DBE08|nr:speckle-type POZ protein B-like [Belonocnema kinseyi]
MAESSVAGKSKASDERSDVTTFTWTIEKFKDKRESSCNSSWKSPTFHIANDPSMEWYLLLCKRKKLLSCSECYDCGLTFIGLSLRNISLGNNFQYPVKVKFSIGLPNKGKLFSRSMKIAKATGGLNYGFQYFLEESELLKHLPPNGNLHIIIKIRPFKSIPKPLEYVDKNFQPFLNNKSLSDVVFYVNGSEFPAHKVILSSASPVFSRMFSNEMRENLMNQVEMTETDPDVFNEMLRYIYTGKVEDLSDVAFDLYELANKYDIVGLRMMCEQCLLNILSVENVIHVLELADCHNASYLKNECIAYIDKHFDDVRKTDPFKTVKRELLVDLLCAVRAKKVKSS